MVTRRGRGKTVCARGAGLARLGGRSASPLDAAYIPSAVPAVSRHSGANSDVAHR